MKTASRCSIEIDDLWFAYAGQTVFQRFSWCTSDRLNLLLGPSGCGKTTLLRLLIQDLQPQRAKILNTPGRAGLILQEDALFPWLTAQENLDLVPQALRSPTASRVVEPLASLVSSLYPRRVAELSFGERRAVELVRTLSLDVPVLLLDEPLNFLDRDKRSAAVASMVAAAQEGRTLVASTHYPADYTGFNFARFTFARDLPSNHLQLESD